MRTAASLVPQIAPSDTDHTRDGTITRRLQEHRRAAKAKCSDRVCNPTAQVWLPKAERHAARSSPRNWTASLAATGTGCASRERLRQTLSFFIGEPRSTRSPPPSPPAHPDPHRKTLSREAGEGREGVERPQRDRHQPNPPNPHACGVARPRVISRLADLHQTAFDRIARSFNQSLYDKPKHHSSQPGNHDAFPRPA